MLDRRRRADDQQHERREVGDSEFVGIAQVDRAALGRVDHCDDAADQVIDITEAARLLAIPVDRYRVAGECLADEVGDDPAVVGAHTRAVGVEYPDHADVDPAGPAVCEGHCLSESLRLVVDAPRADGIDVSPVILGLRMLRVVADTNIYVSAFMFGGLPGLFLDLAFQRAFTLLISPALLDELDEKLAASSR